MTDLRPTILTAAIAIAGTALAVPAGPALAQGYEVVQPLPSPAASELSRAMRRLASNPRDVDALILAGNASLELNDIDAAVGFFGRAEELVPYDPRVKSGKAAAFVRSRRPIEALRLFAEAEQAGVQPLAVAADKGLALDLVGNNLEAQQSYRQALSAGNDSETRRRLALSHAISGDREAFESTLLPLLEQRDFAAYRSRAFGLAILGETEEAVSIAEAVMPTDMAQRVEPYLRYMRRLTPAQQAAAANLGVFPRAAAIGRDDPAIAAARVQSGTPALAGVDSGLAPAGRPLGTSRTRQTAAAPAEEASSDGRLTKEQRRALRQQRRDAVRLGSRSERQVRVATTSQAPAPPTAQAPQPVARTVAPTPTAPVASAPVAPSATARPVERGELPALAGSGAAPATTPPAAASATATTAAPAPARVVIATPAAAAPSQIVVPPAEAASVRADDSVRTVAQAPTVPTEIATPAASSAQTGTPTAIASVDIEPSSAAQLPPVSGTPSDRQPVTVAVLEAGNAAPGFDLSRSAEGSQPVRSGTASAAPAILLPPAEPATTQPPASVSEAFADFLSAPAAAADRSADAVDITAIEIRREVEEQPVVETPKPAQPSRIWVQVATGRDRDALGFDWRRFSRQASDTLSGKGPFVTPWGETNRLLAGPFESRDAANAAVRALADAGIGAFRFTSDEGQAIEPLD